MAINFEKITSVFYEFEDFTKSLEKQCLEFQSEFNNLCTYLGYQGGRFLDELFQNEYISFEEWGTKIGNYVGPIISNLIVKEKIQEYKDAIYDDINYQIDQYYPMLADYVNKYEQRLNSIFNTISAIIQSYNISFTDSDEKLIDELHDEFTKLFQFHVSIEKARSIINFFSEFQNNADFNPFSIAKLANDKTYVDKQTEYYRTYDELEDLIYNNSEYDYAVYIMSCINSKIPYRQKNDYEHYPPFTIPYLNTLFKQFISIKRKINIEKAFPDFFYTGAGSKYFLYKYINRIYSEEKEEISQANKLKIPRILFLSIFPSLITLLVFYGNKFNIFHFNNLLSNLFFIYFISLISSSLIFLIIKAVIKYNTDPVHIFWDDVPLEIIEKEFNRYVEPKKTVSRKKIEKSKNIKNNLLELQKEISSTEDNQ